MIVNYVLMYGTPYLKYREFETFEDVSKFLVNKGIVNYSIFKKLEDKEEVEMIYRDNDIHYLEKENKRLKDLCNKYEEEHKTTYEIWKKDIYLYNSLVDRIDKAIEYIENKNKYLDSENYYQVFEYRDIYLKPLLDILKGVDKE